ncbi:MAG: MFS transporter [Clostridia bacterium]|nr:MFS transporter [Clostridia bacterium]
MINPVKYIFSKEEHGDSVANRRLFNYGLGLAGQNMTYSYISGWLRYFCINMLHIDAAKVGGIFFASNIWDAVNDPLIGSFVDRHRSKKGEKLRPYLIYTPPIIGALSFAMFFNIEGLSEVLKLCYILLIFFIWDFIYSFQDVALWGMVSVCSPSSKERSRAAKWAGIGAGAGSTVASFFQTFRSAFLGLGLSDYEVFLLFAFIFGFLGEIISMRAHKMPERVQSDTPKESLFKTIGYLKYNRTLILISVARILCNLNFKVQNAYFFESSTNNIFSGIDGMNLEFLFGTLSGLTSAGAVFFATQLAEKCGGMKKLLVTASVAEIACRAVAFFVGFKSPTQVIICGLLFSIFGVFTSNKDFAHRSLISDSIDDVEYRTGVRIEGISFSMQNFVSKINTGTTSLMEGIILKLLRYDSKIPRTAQNATFMKMQWPMYALGPAIGAALYLIVILFVKDNKEERLRVEYELRQRRERAKELEQTENATVS